jgi:hypothetical protein
MGIDRTSAALFIGFKRLSLIITTQDWTMETPMSAKCRLNSALVNSGAALPVHETSSTLERTGFT